MKKWMFIFLFLSGLSWAQDPSDQYVISSGDRLSCIAEKFIGYPVYGPQGSMQLILQQNPWIQNQDMIANGKWIELPSKDAMATFSKGKISATCAQSESRLANEDEIQKLHDHIAQLETKIDQLQNTVEKGAQSNQVVQSQHPLDAFVNRHQYYAGIGFLYHRIDGKDTTNNASADVLSDISWQLEFGWTTPMRVNPSYFTRVHSHLQYYRYSEDITGATVADQSILAPGLRVSVGKYFGNDRMDIEAFVGVDREFYFFTSNLNAIEFDADWIGKIGTQLDFRVLRTEKFRLGLRGYGEVLGLGGFLDDGGWHAGGNLYFAYRQHELRTNFVYGSMSATRAEFETYEANIVYRIYL